MANKSQSRHRGYLKDMLVSKFLAKHKLEIMGPTNNATREIEFKIQQLVVKEFEKFMKAGAFNQKNLLIFEKGLINLIKENIGDNASVKIREQTAPMTHRREIKTNGGLEGGFDQYVRNSTSVTGSKGAHIVEGLNQNVSLPAIRPNTYTRNSMQKFKNTGATHANQNGKDPQRILIENKFNNYRRV